MEPYYPTHLDDYCKHFSVSFFDLSLHCIFCGHLLDTQQLADFYRKRLSLVWRANNCFACCLQCCRVSARHEFEQYCRCSVSAGLIQDILHKPLSEIIIRCHGCLTLLDLAEKVDAVNRGDLFYLVRKAWKGLCRQCTPK
ncbi:E6 protein [Human papillomavirus type 211]|uniref:Protein E6 n=1 Tax=Human papillomavirus type 211 TaxID=2060135 RepID=A0A2H4V8C5_9PAPI|nr:E6 protein [Human papillomavirus type 211]